MEKEKQIMEFLKNEDGISVNFEDETEIIDVIIAVGLAIDMIMEQEKVSKQEVFSDIDKVLDAIKADRKEKGEDENGGK